MEKTKRLLRPSLLYKYKPFSDKTDQKRLEEILVENKLYFPSLKELNDPMESCSVHFELQIAGAGYHRDAGKVHSVIESIQEKYGILSFTATPNSPIMWAHYGNEYTGCCLIFSSKNGIFSAIEPTIYSNISFEYSEEEVQDNNLDKYVREALFFKDKDWAYENEWRYIEYRETEKISLEHNDIKGVIVGERMSQKRQKKISKICKTESIPCFRTYVMNDKKTIGIVPVEYTHAAITRSAINQYMTKKRDNGKCVGDEYSLFGLLNSDIAWDENKGNTMNI